MPVKKLQNSVWQWLKITLLAFWLLCTVILLLLVLFTILRVPSFIIGNQTIWLLRWQYQPGTRFAVQFNPVTVFIIATVIGLIGLWLTSKGRQRR